MIKYVPGVIVYQLWLGVIIVVLMTYVMVVFQDTSWTQLSLNVLQIVL